VRGKPPELAGDIFRALTPILAERANIKSVALPVVAAGNQGHAIAEMLAPLLMAALHWLEAGLPLDRIKIVTHSDAEAQKARRVFSEKKFEYFQSAPVDYQKIDYDVFLSYSRANERESEALEQALCKSQPGIKIFLDRNEIDIGAAWQRKIFESLDRCRKVVAMLSRPIVPSPQ
jgi:hypothetical protein